VTRADGDQPWPVDAPATELGAVGADGTVAGSSDASGTLYVVSTPIGNLGDVTLRAIEVLRSVPLVAAEDTRLTRRLWSRHGIETRLTSFHAQSPPSRLTSLVDHLARGEDLAIVTDAGTPLVSDPGESLVAAWAARGGRVVPIPGASSVLAALVASGLPAARWGFEGFLPRRGAERRARLARIAADDRATVLFEAPGRTAATLRDLAAACGAERRAALCRELTKLHEEITRGSLAHLTTAAEGRPPRGEVTIVVEGSTGPVAGADGTAAAPSEEAMAQTLADARERVDRLVSEEGMRRSEAARTIAAETGLARRDLFREPGSGR
jgi:16S rRNA (cytidine1402-2'-O)-methyltransferase